MDELREGLYLRAREQKYPLVEYKNEGYEFFITLMDAIKQDALENLFRSATCLEAFLTQLHSGPAENTLKLNHPEGQPAGTTGRNNACTCGSGKKFKQRCGRMGVMPMSRSPPIRYRSDHLYIRTDCSENHLKARSFPETSEMWFVPSAGNFSGLHFLSN